MKKYLLTVVALGSLLIAGQASADKALMEKSGCIACHGVNEKGKKMGPAFKDVAAKYKGNKSAEAKLVTKVKDGGGGVWGNIPMPANGGHVKEGDINTIVKWILSL